MSCRHYIYVCQRLNCRRVLGRGMEVGRDGHWNIQARRSKAVSKRSVDGTCHWLMSCRHFPLCRRGRSMCSIQHFSAYAPYLELQITTRRYVTRCRSTTDQLPLPGGITILELHLIFRKGG